jgi:hypothetical protein
MLTDFDILSSISYDNVSGLLFRLGERMVGSRKLTVLSLTLC